MRIAIADDHTLFRESLKALLRAKGYEVVGEASNGREAIAIARQASPDVLLLDLTMPEVDGLTATREICLVAPDVRVVILTASEEDDALFEALKAGAQGYLIKSLEMSEFFTLLEAAGRGEPALSPGLARKVLRELRSPRSEASEPSALTDREREILDLMVDGTTSTRQLARRLDISENTVKFHIGNILSKLHLRSRAQAVGFAIRKGLVSTDKKV